MNLAEWLAYQERIHPQPIALGLERIAEVKSRIHGNTPPPFSVITVTGTNGKGSCVALLEAILHNSGYRVGVYTSPHLLRYNERIRIQRREVSDAELCIAFSRIETARGTIPLTYFEYGTLAALDLFYQSNLNWVILEVGLGGRLDATNILDPDVSIVTTVDLDHLDWLGPDRESIGREKAGIFRSGRPAICGDSHPPESLIARAHALNAPLYIQSRDFGWRTSNSSEWEWWSNDFTQRGLPIPRMRGVHQYHNAATVLMALSCIANRTIILSPIIHHALITVELPGRFQILPGAVPVILDVAHNPQAAISLAGNLDAIPSLGKTHAVIAMLADKDITGVVAALRGRIDTWYLAPISGARGAPAERIAESLDQIKDIAPRVIYSDITTALASAYNSVIPSDRIVVFGSFHTVAAAIRYHERTTSVG